MIERRRRHDELLGASVVLTGWADDRRATVGEALALLSQEPVDLDGIRVPFLVLAKAPLEKAERVRDHLVEAGATVELRDEWVTRESRPEVAARPACPFCGSVATQPFTHAGPGAHKRRKCTRCGRVFGAGRSG
jgi:hypothetical protein